MKLADILSEDVYMIDSNGFIITEGIGGDQAAKIRALVSSGKELALKLDEKMQKAFRKEFNKQIAAFMKASEKNSFRAMDASLSNAQQVYAKYNKQNSLNEANEMDVLKKGRTTLSGDERDECMSAKAVWHHGPNGEETPAIWKSKCSKTGKCTYVTNTHRAMATSKTLKGAIKEYHSFIKGTA